jgi:hypothetical protein
VLKVRPLLDQALLFLFKLEVHPTPNKLLWALAIYNLVGGCVGLFFVGTAFLLALQSASFPWAILYFAFVFGLSVASFYTYRKTGSPLLMGIYAILQLPYITYDGLKYYLNNGILLITGLQDSSNLIMTFESYTVKFGFAQHSSDNTTVCINVISVITLLYLVIIDNKRVKE